MKLKIYKVLVGTDAAIPQVRADIDREATPGEISPIQENLYFPLF